MREHNGNSTGAESVARAMARIATELSVGVVRRKRGAPTRVNFYALDGTICVVIEADSEDDARYLCREMRLEFIGFCHG